MEKDFLNSSLNYFKIIMCVNNFLSGLTILSFFHLNILLLCKYNEYLFHLVSFYALLTHYLFAWKIDAHKLGFL